MKILKKRSTAVVITTFLAITVMLGALQVTNAQLPVVKVPMFIFAAAAPDPVGVGQTVAITYWTSLMPLPTYDDPKYGAPGGRECWTGITLTITKPNGDKQTIPLPPSDPVGCGYYMFTPDQVGVWKAQVHFPAQWRNVTTWPPWGSSQNFPAGRAYLLMVADSNVVTFTVQSEPVYNPISDVELPTEYWTRPIHYYNRRWSEIAGNWISNPKALPYVTAPATPHIMWTQEYFYGGIAGGEKDWISYYEGTAYEAKFTGVTIIGGKLFYNLNLGSSSSGSYQHVVCRDLRTGELIWKVNKTSLSFGWIYLYSSRNQHGVHPYLWCSGNRILDPFSGIELFRYTDVPSGTGAFGPNGEYLIYVFGGPSGKRWLACWNSTAALSMTAITSSQLAYYKQTGLLLGTGYDQWRPVGKTINGTEAYSWNVTITPADSNLNPQSWTINVLSDIIIAGEGFKNFGTAAPEDRFRIWAVSLKKETRGKVLFDIKPHPPVPNGTLQLHTGMASEENGVFLVRSKDTQQWMCFDIKDGKQLWISDPGVEKVWMMFSRSVYFAKGMFITGGYGGEIYVYDIKNGKLLRKMIVDSELGESVYDYPPLSLQIVDGKIYARASEHSMSQPYYRTWKIYCFDLETGDRLWDLNGAWSSAGFSDGYMVALNYFDGLIYCIGKGPTSTKVTASPNTICNGASVLIEGTIRDISAGAKDPARTARFPNGVPAVADENMVAWMEYVYMQKPRPADVKGVEVTLDAVAPNGTFIHIGRVTADADGMFKKLWQPPSEGEYTIIATFEGSESYWPSYAETAVGVTAAPPPSATAEQTGTLQSIIEAQQPLTIALMVLVVIAIVIGVVNLYALIKRK